MRVQTIKQIENNLYSTQVIYKDITTGQNNAFFIKSVLRDSKFLNSSHNFSSLMPTMKKFVKALKERCDSPEDRLIKTLRDAQEWIVVGRWLQGLRGEEHDALRWELIRNPNVDQIERSRWIERLIGRCDEPILVEEARRFIDEEHPDLLLQAAQNLSTAYDKLDL